MLRFTISQFHHSTTPLSLEHSTSLVTETGDSLTIGPTQLHHIKLKWAGVNKDTLDIFNKSIIYCSVAFCLTKPNSC